MFVGRRRLEKRSRVSGRRQRSIYTFHAFKKRSQEEGGKMKVKMNLPRGCVTCPWRALMEGQLYAQASLEKNGNMSILATCF